jgi:hypothetical protein
VAFLLYSVDSQGTWDCTSEVVLCRALAEHARSILPAKKPPEWWEYQWLQSEDDLVAYFKRELGLSPARYKLVIDLKRGDKKNVSLYQIEKIWGITTLSWTPLALHLRGLVVDKPKSNPSEFKKSFRPVDDSDHSDIHEFCTADMMMAQTTVGIGVVWAQLMAHSFGLRCSITSSTKSVRK